MPSWPDGTSGPGCVHPCTLEALEDARKLRFIGIVPSTGQGDSLTVWADESKGEPVIQEWKPDAATEAECPGFEVPGHAVAFSSTRAWCGYPPA